MASWIGTGASNPGDVATSGKLGVGTTSPSEEVHVYGSGDMKVKVQSTNSHASVWILNDKGSFNIQVEDATGRLRIWDVSGGNEVFTISKGTAAIGIRNSDPRAPLHVNGHMRLEPQTNQPAGGSTGDMYVDTSGNLHVHTGAGWKRVQYVP